MTDAPYRPTARSMRALAAIVGAYEKISGFSGYLRPTPTAVDRTIRMRVTEVDAVADGVAGLRFEPLDERPLPRWQPGAHIDVELDRGLLRQYSLCSDPADRGHFDIAVRLVAGGAGSAAMHALQVGGAVTVRGPRNAFPFVEAGRYLFVAGGIGITPIRAMVRDAERRGADWTLVYTGRTRSSMPFAEELATLGPGRVHLRPDDEFGVPDGREIVSLIGWGAALYVCGPPAMVDVIRSAMPAENIDTLHTERFSPAPVIAGEPFEAVLARSGHVVAVGADETALTAIRRVLPDVAYSCRQGFCGTCPVGLIGGDVEHRDRCLSDAQRVTAFAPCVSRASGRVTLDL